MYIYCSVPIQKQGVSSIIFYIYIYIVLSSRHFYTFGKLSIAILHFII